LSTTAVPPLEDLERVRARVAERLEPVERVVAVMSGKGGVGKSAVAANLALALSAAGARVGLLDADLHGPSLAKMLGLRGHPVCVRGDALAPIRGPRGLAVQSMDFFLQGNQPLDWDGPSGEAAPLRSALEDAALADFLARTEWGALDALVVDLAPGSDRLPALARTTGRVTGCVAVTIPTEVALLAVERSLRRAREARIPVIGLVENFAALVCAHCGSEAPLFPVLPGCAPVEALARDLDVELLARVPFEPALAACADAGRPFLEGDGLRSTAGRAFATLAARVLAFRPEEVDTW
jgi:ATP-binding protein involved in chromosome partitioning